MAMLVIEENRRYVGEDIAEEAIEEIQEEGGISNEEIEKKTTRGRKKKAVN